jgi:serine/threonine-protein kinase
MSTFEEQLKDSLHHAYEIERELGGGGMSRVFVATDRLLGRKIVVKVLSPELVESVNRARFRREIQIAAQLQHPHNVTLLSAGEQGDIVYFTMPFIDGESLRSALEHKGPLQVRDTLRVLYDGVDALSYAHGQGVVHRDIKPANSLRSGIHSMVTDFGVAKALNAAMPKSGMTSTGMAMGTPAYMAPEQLAGDPSADHRIDIYAVGLLAYELLAGQSPFSGATPAAVMAALFTMNPTPLNKVRSDVPKKLSDVVMHCLQKEPEQRPPTADALMTLLDSVATTSGEIRTREHKVPTGKGKAEPLPPVVVKPKTPVEKTFVVESPDEEKKSRTGLILGAIAALALIGVAGFMFSQRGGKAGASTAAANTATDSAGKVASLAPGAPGAAGSVAPVAAPVMTAADSMAIANAVAKRIAATAAAEAAKKPGSVKISEDSINKLAKKAIADSISRAKAAAVAAAPPVAAPAPAPAPLPAPSTPLPAGTKRSLGIADAVQSSQATVTTYSKAFNDALRRAVGDADNFSFTEGDPEVLVTPSYVGSGDTVTVSVSIRNTKTGSIKVLSAKVMPAYPQYYVEPVIKAVVKQLEPFAK